ncbi:MAG: hypothetical protein V3S71_06455 [Acidobacteriota bacterium]
MEDLILTWGDPETKEEYAVHCSLSAAYGLQVDVQQRLAGKTVKLTLPHDFAEDLAKWFSLAQKKIERRLV